jgi:hypothetical protein
MEEEAGINWSVKKYADEVSHDKYHNICISLYDCRKWLMGMDEGGKAKNKLFWSNYNIKSRNPMKIKSVLFKCYFF